MSYNTISLILAIRLATDFKKQQKFCEATWIYDHSIFNNVSKFNKLNGAESKDPTFSVAFQMCSNEIEISDPECQKSKVMSIDCSLNLLDTIREVQQSSLSC
ncbi:hypothetical protein TNIN_265031 [Trichonephila inaurata madagascariensis]|uniref:Uncharacterized protein n=1 Tax=Trichonephila inaurata madagascariensis TaxID=2747483 RepID=A0A8X6IRJ5_9ARAC|nr:hypothetical protein TNIN_265031 [Trichonephila inaurata madagascariensis]